METIIETFIQKDSEQLIYDNEQLNEWKRLIEELGLEGQKILGSDNKSPIPFMFLKRPDIEIFEILCPEKCEANKYDKTPIPLEVLGIMKLCENEQYFTKIEIWWDDVKPDPIMIGIKQIDDTKNKYLLARWGDEKMNIEILYKKALGRLMDDWKNRLETKIRACQKQLDNLENECMQKLSGKWTYCEG